MTLEIDVLTLFPAMIEGPLSLSIPGRIQADGLATIFDLSLTVTPARWITVEAYGALAPEEDVIRSIYPGAGTGRLAYLEVELRR